TTSLKPLWCGELPAAATRRRIARRSRHSPASPQDCAPPEGERQSSAQDRTLHVVAEADLLHQAVQFAALLLGGTSRAPVAEDEEGLVRRAELLQLLGRRGIEAIERHILGGLTARYEFQHLVGVRYALFAHGDAVADPHLARRLGI